jgi:hypothetical protein
MARTAQEYLSQARGFVRDYTAGLNVRDVRRLFDQEVPNAYAVLARDHSEAPAPHGRLRGLKRLLYGTKIVFLGVSLKLSPVRRLIFALSLLCAVLGILLDNEFVLATSGFYLSLDAATIWFGISIICLAFLLTVELVDRVRVRDELEVARQLQGELLPRDAPALPGYSFAHSYRTANEVGGDYYNFSSLPDGRLALMVGDASGHGIAAGLLMAIANATLKTAIEIDPAPQRVAALLNSTLFRTGDRRAFMTLFYSVLDPTTGQLEFVCGGHPFPLLRRAGGSVEELGEGSLPLGMKESAPLSAGSVTLEPGDLLVLFTDGLPEAVGGKERSSFGFARMRELLDTAGSPARVHDRMIMAFDQYVGDAPLKDDYTLVVMARK